MTDQQMEAMLNGFMSQDCQKPKVIDVHGFPIVTSPNMTPEEEARLIKAVSRNLFEFGPRVEWHGWDRCLWLGVQLDLKCRRLSVMLFGLSLSVGYHLRNLPLNAREEVK